MTGGRSSPSAPSPRGGTNDQTAPSPSSSPRRGGRNPDHATDTDPSLNTNSNPNSNRPLVNLDPTKCKVFNVQSNPPSDLAAFNGFIIKKALTYEIGTPHKCTRLRSGMLRVEVTTTEQALQLYHNLKQINGLPVSVVIPYASNTCKGVVTHHDFARMTETEIVTEMADLGVVACRKFYRTDRTTHQKVPTNTVCLTFATTQLPDSIFVAYEPRSVRPFIPKPLRCNKCQKYGHTQLACRSSPVCFRCGDHTHQENSCTANAVKCASCGGPHLPSDPACPVWKRESDVVKVVALQGVSYREARARVEAVVNATPVPGVSYSAVARPSATTTLAGPTTSTSTSTVTQTADAQTSTNIESTTPRNTLKTITPTYKPTNTLNFLTLGDDINTEDETTTDTSTTNTTDEDNTQMPPPSTTQTTPNTQHHRGTNPVRMIDSSTNKHTREKTPQQQRQSRPRSRSGANSLTVITPTNTYKVQKHSAKPRQFSPATVPTHNSYTVLETHTSMDTDTNATKRVSSPASSEEGGAVHVSKKGKSSDYTS